MILQIWKFLLQKNQKIQFNFFTKGGSHNIFVSVLKRKKDKTMRFISSETDKWPEVLREQQYNDLLAAILKLNRSI